jgi:phage replication-related protein YjqB (UPF0714/DUF867 family)
VPDKYRSFAELALAEPDAYTIRVTNVAGSLVVAAPHGGSIEPGTSEIALAIAKGDFACYLFEGTKPSGNRSLHITSSQFDEPRGLAFLRAAATAVTIHGEDSPEELVFVGGRHTTLLASVRDALELSGFVVRKHSNRQLQGLDPRNICNIGQCAAGLQLELSKGRRKRFFHSLSAAGRLQPTRRQALFCSSVHGALLQTVRAGLCNSMSSRSQHHDNDRKEPGTD